MTKDEIQGKIADLWYAYCARHSGKHPWDNPDFQRWIDWRQGYYELLRAQADTYERE